jgi:hypothetical protein
VGLGFKSRSMIKMDEKQPHGNAELFIADTGGGRRTIVMAGNP